MFNYQSEVYNRLVDNWYKLNVTENLSKNLDKVAEGVHVAANIAYETIPLSVRESEFLNSLYAEWKTYYEDAYKWIHPRLTELSNTTLHYGTGVSVGVVASILVLVFIISKFLPSKLKNLGYILMLFGGSISLWLLSSIGNFVSDPVTDTLVKYWQYVLSYIVVSGVLSFALVYRYGPVTDERSLSLIQWFLQIVGLVLVYNSTQIREVSIALVLVLLAIYNFPKNIIINNRSKNLWYRFFPPKIKLLTEDEYFIQGNIETKKELEKLREYCRSPDCQAWKIISKLKSPHRFADFVTKGAWHVSEMEQNTYESHDEAGLSDNDAPSDTESDLVFVLGSPSRTVRASFAGGF